jgi:recombinase
MRIGRPPTVPQSVVRRVQRQRSRGDSLRKIAGDLNCDGVPTAQGGKEWYAANGAPRAAQNVLCGGAGPTGLPPRLFGSAGA